jgi:ABC-2 type transport system ATP-binding protein
MAGAGQLRERVPDLRLLSAERRPAPPTGIELVADGVRLERGRRTILDEVRFRLTPGITALLGPNGIGKSTLLRSLAGLDEPAAGTIEIGDGFGRIGSAGRDYRSHLGYLPQDPTFIGRFTVTEALTYAAWLHRVDEGDRAVRRTTTELRLTAEASTQLRRLSGGTRRRALLGMAVVHRPSVLLLDEPTVGMDAEHRHAFRLALEALRTTTVILTSTHTLGDLGDECRRILLLGGRSVVFDGTPDELEVEGQAIEPDQDRLAESGIDRAIRRLGVPR